MKRAAVDHPKLQRLQKALGIPRYAAMGVLEALWHFAARYAPQGDVGRWLDAEIADWVDWEREPAALIEALVSTRWLDPHPEYRLIVHDWHEHADEATKLTLKRNKLDFITQTGPRSVAVSNGVATSLDMSPPPEPEPEPSQSQSHPLPEPEPACMASPNAPKANRSAMSEASERAWGEFLAVYPDRDGDRKTAPGRTVYLSTLRSGVSPDEILDGAQRYRAWCKATGTFGTQFVQQIPTWLRSQSWKEPWSAVKARPRGREPTAAPSLEEQHAALMADYHAKYPEESTREP